MATQLGVKIRSSYLGQEGIVGRFPPGTSIVEECRDSIYAVRLTELQLTGEVVNPPGTSLWRRFDGLAVILYDTKRRRWESPG